MNKVNLLVRTFVAVFPSMANFNWDDPTSDEDLIFKDDIVALSQVDEPPYKKIIKVSNYINKLPPLRSAINYADPYLKDMNAVPRDLVLAIHGIISNDERAIELIEKLEITSGNKEKEEIMKAVTDQSQNTKTPAPVVGAAIDDLIDAEDRASIDRATTLHLKILTTGFSFAKASIAFAAKMAVSEELEMETSLETIHELVIKRPVEAFMITFDQPLGVNPNAQDAIERFSTLLEEAVTEPADAFYHRIIGFINNETPMFFNINDGVLTPNDEMTSSIDILTSINNADVYYVTTLFKLLLVNLDGAKNVGEVITDAFYTAQLAEKMR